MNDRLDASMLMTAQDHVDFAESLLMMVTDYGSGRDAVLIARAEAHINMARIMLKINGG